MVIVLIFWKIHPEAAAVESFLYRWKQLMPVSNRSELMCEFVCHPLPVGHFEWVTESLSQQNHFLRYVSVGLWSGPEGFYDQLGKYFTPEKGKEPFEVELRTRVVLSPEAWRLGMSGLPSRDSEDTI